MYQADGIAGAQANERVNPETAIKDAWEQLKIASTEQFNITAADLLNYFKYSMHGNLLQELVREKIVGEELAKNEIEVSDDEVQEAINKFRIHNHLLTSASTQRWMARQRISSTQLWFIFERQTKIEKLKNKLFDDETVREEFFLNKLDFARVEYYQIIVSNEKKAHALEALFQEGSSFFDLARKFSEDKQTQRASGYVGIVNLVDLDAEIQSKLNCSDDGELIGPFKHLGLYYLLFKIKSIPANYDKETENIVREKLFSHWCAERAASIPVEMHI